MIREAFRWFGFLDRTERVSFIDIVVFYAWTFYAFLTPPKTGHRESMSDLNMSDGRTRCMNYMGYVFTPMFRPHVQHKSIILCTYFPRLNALDFCRNPSMTPAVKHLSKCCRIKFCSKLVVIASSNPPLAISNAKAIVNRPQSTAPFCRWTFGTCAESIRKITKFW